MWIYCTLKTLHWKFFHRSAFLNNLHLSWKTEFSLNFFTVLTIYFLSFRTFEQLSLALKNRLTWNYSLYWNTFIIQDFWATYVCPGNFHCIEYTFYIQDFWATCACPENKECALNSLTECTFFYHSGFLSNLRLSWKTELPWNFSLFWNIFIIQEFWATCACPENRACPEIFHWIEIFFIIQQWATCASPENRICPENFQAGRRQPPLATRLVRLWAYGISDENTIFYIAWKMTISKRHE